MAIGADGDARSAYLPVLLWLVYEIGDVNLRYILTLGRWFRLAEGYAAKLNEDLKKIRDVTTELSLPKWAAGDEGKYNADAANARGDLVLMDKVHVKPSEGGNVESCDLLHRDGYLIHVKRYNQSQTLSHLFSQGNVAVELLRADEDYRKDFVKKVTARDASFKVVAESAPKTVTFAIGLSDDRDLPLDLPIFSKVNLRDHAKRIRVAGVEPTIARIEMT